MARLLDAKAGRLAETKTHILCPRPASNRQKLKYSVELAGEVPEVQNQRRGRIDFGGRSRTFRTLVGTFQNKDLCDFDVATKSEEPLDLEGKSGTFRRCSTSAGSFDALCQ